jgi:hypothetical protein
VVLTVVCTDEPRHILACLTIDLAVNNVGNLLPIDLLGLVLKSKLAVSMSIISLRFIQHTERDDFSWRYVSLLQAFRQISFAASSERVHRFLAIVHAEPLLFALDRRLYFWSSTLNLAFG